jgi:two-component system, NtrC family, response regulator AtoC
MQDLFRRVARVAPTEATVLVRGETGTGKELVARAIHVLGPRQNAPFQAVNCATFTPELLASELFGHVRGAFTGAVRDRPGLFRLADGGTLFLDEVAEIPLEIQARLLRVIQEQRFVPVGGTQPVEVNVRIVAATHRALRREVQEGRFREDLMYRIRVVPLFLPRLVERSGDVALLAHHFLRELGAKSSRPMRGFAPATLALMLAYDWPGNVRELHNVVEYAVIMSDGPLVQPHDLTPELRGEAPTADRKHASVQDQERDQILAALAQSRGRKGEAAERLGWNRSTLWRKMRELQMQATTEKGPQRG